MENHSTVIAVYPELFMGYI